jgi:hypothetical protein
MKNQATKMIFTTILLGLVFFGLLPKGAAVLPPPDGGYPGGNTAEGQNALLSLTTGGFNTAVGWLALRSNTENGFNTAIGAGALLSNISAANTATGAAALLSTTGGGNNTANGALALFSNTTGQSNTAMGSGALLSNTTVDNNTGIGFHTLFMNTIGNRNTAMGSEALSSNVGGSTNTATGYQALFHNTTSGGNTANGTLALFSNITGDANTAVGGVALLDNTEGHDNTAVGTNALGNNTTGDNNTALGAGAGVGVTTANGVIVIGANISGADVNNSCYIGNIWNQPGGSQAVYVNSEGKLGQIVSSRRFKDEIKRMERASEVIYGLKPVTFRYKSEIEPTRPLGFGLIAEEVEKVSPDLVSRDSERKVNSVRYDAVNAMLLNEFLKEHKTVQELKSVLLKQEAIIAQLSDDRANHQTTISNLGKVLNAVLVRLNEQDSKIQKVNDRLELSEPVTQLALKEP